MGVGFQHWAVNWKGTFQQMAVNWNRSYQHWAVKTTKKMKPFFCFSV